MDNASSVSKIEPVFETWVQAHYQEDYRYAYRLCAQQATAEDITQQVFLNAWRYRDQLRDPDKSRSWLLAMTRNQFFKELRKTKPLSFSKWEVEPADFPVVSAQHRHELGMDLQQLLLSMSTEYRVVLMMFFFEGMTYKEIADELKIKMGTVMSRLSRAKEQLRAILAESEYQD